MKTRKIALCIPNLSWQASDNSVRWHMVPYGLCLLAATIRDLCATDIIDANMENLSPDEFRDRVRNGKYDLVGISVLMDGFAECGFLAAELARNATADASMPIVMGGVFPTVHSERVISSPAVDYVVIGEGEEVFRALLSHLWHGAPLPAKGLAYIDADGRPRIQSKADPIMDLDALPLPAYELIDFGKYARNEPRKAVAGSALLPYAHLLTSRGCPFNCSYCQVEFISGRRFRPRGPESILDEIAWLKNTYGIRSFLIDYVKIFTVIPLRGTALWDLCVRANAIATDFDSEKVSWNEGQIISDQFTSGELTLLRAYEWDRINFSTVEKCERICEQMSIGMEELETIRRNTRSDALKRLRPEGDSGYPGSGR